MAVKGVRNLVVGRVAVDNSVEIGGGAELEAKVARRVEVAEDGESGLVVLDLWSVHEAAETRVVELDVGARPADPVQPAHEREEGLVSDGAVVLLAGRPCHGHELGAARRLDRRGEVFGALRAEVLLVQLADVVGLEDSQLAGGSIASNVEADHAPRLRDAGGLEGAAVAREGGVDSSLGRALVADEDVVDVDDGDDVASVIKDDAEEVWVGGALLEPARLEDGGVLLLEDGATLLGPLEALEQTARLEFWVDEAVGLLMSRMECVESGGMLEYLSDVMLWFVLPVDSAFPLAGSSMMMQVMSSWLSALPHNSASMSSNRIERMELSRTRLRDSQTAEVPFMTTEVSSRISREGAM